MHLRVIEPPENTREVGRTRVGLGNVKAQPSGFQRDSSVLSTFQVFRWGYITRKQVIHFVYKIIREGKQKPEKWCTRSQSERA